MIDTAQLGSVEAIPNERTPTRTSIPAAALGLAGVFFLLYPAIRPFSDEASLAGARAFASSSWIVAHTLGIFGFLLFALGAFGLQQRLQDTPVGRRVTRALLLVWVGVGLTLPYYGAEVFGLHAVGQEALARNDVPLLKTLIHSVRWTVGIWFIVTGLLLLAVAAVMLATAVWQSGVFHRWSGVPLAAALVLYIPQFSGPQSLRVAHGVLMLVGCAWLARNLAATSPEDPR